MKISSIQASQNNKRLAYKNPRMAANISFQANPVVKLFKSKKPLAQRLELFWIDIKRNYCVYDFEKSGGIKNKAWLKNPIIKKIFDFFELPLKNFKKVSEKYYRGGILTCEYDILRLKEKGITDIISLVEKSKFNQQLAEVAQRNGMTYHHIELPPPYGIPADAQLEQFLKIAKETKGAVYVHCLHGKDRTGIMSFMYEVELLKQNPVLAVKNMIKAGINAKKNVEMIDFLAQRYPLSANLLAKTKN